MCIHGPCKEIISLLLYPSRFQTCKLCHFPNLSTKHTVQEDSGMHAKKAPHALNKHGFLQMLL